MDKSVKFKTDGLIIKEQTIGENDKLVTVLTDTLGIIKAFARGAKKLRSPKTAATQLLCYSRLGIYKRKDKYIIDEAVVKNMFVGLRSDVFKLSLAQYFCDLAQRLCPAEQPAHESLRLILNGIYLIALGSKNPMLVKACVEMRLLCLSGYMPDLLMCAGCGKYEGKSMSFLPEKGKLFCEDCIKIHGYTDAPLLSAGTVRALRHTVYADFEKLFSFNLSENSLKALNDASERYLTHCTEYDFKTLQFLKSIK